MALITCPNCGKQASNKAQKCFVCGYKTLDLISFPEDTPPLKEIKPTQVTTRTSTSTVDESQVRCPQCGSTQLIANKQGFGLGKAVVGGLLTGGVGLLGGFLGSNDLRINCLSCGHKWDPKKRR